MTEQHATKRRWYGHPFVTGALLLLLLADLFSIPTDHYYTSTVKHEILRLRYMRSTAHGRPVPGKAFRTDAGIQWRWPADDNYDVFRADVLSDPFQYAIVFRDIDKCSGFYHMTRRTESFKVWPNELSVEDQQAVLDAILVAIEREPVYAEGLLFVPEMIRAGVRTRSFPVYTGYARNALAACLLLALLFCIARGKSWEWFREPRLGFYSKYSLSERRRMRHQCVACGYDLEGLESNICPECGLTRETPSERP